MSMTITRSFAKASSPHVAVSYDQLEEAAAVLMSRIAVFKAKIDDSPGVLKLLWLDRMLI